MKRSKRAKSEKGPVGERDASPRHQPLAGKIIYLDVKDARLVRSLEHKIKKLGAAVERFLSKDVNYVISHSAPQRSQVRGQQEGQGPDSPAFANTPSPFSAAPSPSGSEGKILPVTRGKTMAQIACTVRSPSPNTVVSSAEKLGIKVVSVEAAVKWLERELLKMGHLHLQEETDSQQVSVSRKKKSSESGYVKGRKFHQPYIKVESATQLYRPVYKELPAWPHPNVDTIPLSCPFDGRGVGEARQSVRGDHDGRASIGNWASPHSQSGTLKRSVSGEDSSRLVGFPILSAGDLRRQREKRRQIQRRRGYCECCGTKYEDVDEHVKEKSHRDFVRDKQNYESLDELINDGPCTYAFLQTILMRHCKQQRGTKSANSLEDNGSRDQVLTLDPSTPVKKHTTKTTPGVVADFGTERPGFQTPSRRTQCLISVDGHSLQGKQRLRPESPSGLVAGRLSSTAPAGDSATLHENEDSVADCSAKPSPSKQLQAVVIRRSGPKNVYHSPRRTAFRGGVTRIKERSLVFGHSPIGSLQAVIAGENSGFVETGSVAIDAYQDEAALDTVQGSKNCSIEKLDAENADKKKLNTRQGAREKSVSKSRDRYKSGNTERLSVRCESLSGKVVSVSAKFSDTASAQCNIADVDVITHVFSTSIKVKPPGKVASGIARTKINSDSSKKEGAMETKPFPNLSDDNMTPRTPKKKICGEVDSQKAMGVETFHNETVAASESTCSKEKPLKRKRTKAVCLVQKDEALDSNTEPKQDQSQTTPQKGHRLLRSTPMKNERSPSPSFHSVTPHMPRNQTSVLKKQTEDVASAGEEERSSSPVFPRSMIHCSTPVVVTTRKLRHLSSPDAIVQDPEVVSKLLNKPSRPKPRRSILQDIPSDDPPDIDDNQQKEKRASECSVPMNDDGQDKESRSLARRSHRQRGTAQVKAGKLQIVGIHDSEQAPGASTGVTGKLEEKKPLQSQLEAHAATHIVNPFAHATTHTVNPLMHAANCTVNSSGGYMHKGVIDMAELPSTIASHTGHLSPADNEGSMKKLIVAAFSSKRKVKLNSSWLLLSDHSMSRLLHSEPDSSPFQGFTGHDDEGLPSDLTYEEASEVEVSDNEEREWVFDESSSSELDIDTLHNFIPTFSSPGKCSESSWGDACDLYLSFAVQKQLKNKEPKKSTGTSGNSSRKRKRSHSRRRSEGNSSDCLSNKKVKKRQRDTSNTKSNSDIDCDLQSAQLSGLHTPTKRLGRSSRKSNTNSPDTDQQRSQSSDMHSPTKRSRQSSGKTNINSNANVHLGLRLVEGVRKVDKEVAFNYRSPQKMNTAFSPLKVVNGNVVGAGSTTPEMSPSTRRLLKLN